MSPQIIVLSALFVFAVQIPSAYSDPQGYVGCFWDNLKWRALPHFAGLLDSAVKCQERCIGAKWRYAGMQALIQCYCGTTYNYYGPTNKCHGASCITDGGTCGRVSLNSVYLSYIGPKPAPVKGYYGCFRDKKSRAMPDYTGPVASIRECLGKCRERHHPFAGLQNGRECWCGSSYGIYGGSNGCKILCPKGLVCGGKYAMSVYKILNPLEKPKGYVGCFRDKSSRALSHFAGYISSVDECLGKCKARSAPYAGLEAGRECWCGKNYAKYGRADNCNKKCSKGLICGGGYSMSVYSLGYVGCYRDKKSRALSLFAGYISSIHECLGKCRGRSAPYAGLEAGRECWCGKNYAKYGKANNCNKKCSKGMICGGGYSMSVYKI